MTSTNETRDQFAEKPQDVLAASDVVPGVVPGAVHMFAGQKNA